MLHGKHQKGPGGWVTFEASKSRAHGDPFMPEGYDKKDVAAPVATSTILKGKGTGIPEGLELPEADAYRAKYGVGEEDTGFSQEDMASMFSGGGGGGGDDGALMAAIVNLYSQSAVDPRFR